MSTWTVPGYTEQWELGRDQWEAGQSTSGRVVEAIHNATGNRVAIKYLSPALIRDPTFMWEFRSDIEIVRRLRVPQVVQVYRYVEQAGQGAAIVMELVRGVSLHELIERHGPTGPEAALAVLKDSLLGLAAAHRHGLVHRAYKPENVLVDTAGRGKLTDFGLAARTDAPVGAGPALYMAPEQWNGAPGSPETDVYAATAVFFQCLTGKPPFSGSPEDLARQHKTAAVPLNEVDAALRPLIAHGMAKHPAGRPQDTMAFAADLESAAAAADGSCWERRGRGQLAERSAALVPPELPDGGAASPPRAAAPAALAGAAGQGGGRNRRFLAIAAIATVAVVGIGAVATVVTLKARDHQASLSSAGGQSFKAVANVTPPVAASKCTTTTAFAYSGTITAATTGTVSYRWVYSTGQEGPVRTVSFTSPGHTTVVGNTVKARAAGGGWAEIKLISPITQTSDKATYRLLCSGTAGGITPVAAVRPATRTVSCATPPPAFTATGSITASKAEKITYYWALSDGQNSAPATLTFTGKGTQAVRPLTITPPAASGSGEAVLVVTSPVAAASSPATYTLTCAAPQKLSVVAAVSPASETLSSCGAAAPTFTFTGRITDAQAGTVSYHWLLPSGAGPTRTLAFGQAGTQAVAAATYKPASDNATGSGTIVVTGPGTASSNAAAFTLKCPSALTVTTSGAPTTATVGKAYSGTLTATGGKSPYTWSATGLPTGLTISAATGAISGTPSAAGSFPAKVTVRDSSSPALTGTASVSITVSPAPLLISTSGVPTTATAGTAYSGTATVTGGTTPYTWSASGLPAGLSMSAAGVISGTPTTVGSYPATVTVKDSSSPAQTASAPVTITVSPPPALTIGALSPAVGTVGEAFTGTATVTGGVGPYAIETTTLPAGLSATLTAGVLTVTGTPAAAGSGSVTVKDSASPAQTVSVSVTINPAATASA